MPEFGPTVLLTELLCLLLSYVLHVSKEEAAYSSLFMFHFTVSIAEQWNTARKTREERAIAFTAQTNLRNKVTY